MTSWVGKLVRSHLAQTVITHILFPWMKQEWMDTEASSIRTVPGHLAILHLTPGVLGSSPLGSGSEQGPLRPAWCHGDLPPEARERHCPVMGLYSWFSSAHTHRKDPSTFSQKASPQTPLRSSHSFTSGKGSKEQVRCCGSVPTALRSASCAKASSAFRKRGALQGASKPRLLFWGMGT